MRASFLLVILSALSQTYTLPTLRDDLTVLQHHPYQPQRLEDRTNSSYLAKREGTIATLYWDGNGVIKAIFNMDISYQVMQSFQNSGVNLARNVGAECFRYMQQVAVSYFLSGSTWGAQLGSHWRNILHRPHGVGTISFMIILDRRFSSVEYLIPVLEALEQWFTQGGNSVILLQVPNALIAGNAEGNPITVERSVAEELTSGDTRFCQSPIQNSPFTFTGGTLDDLLEPLIKC